MFKPDVKKFLKFNVLFFAVTLGGLVLDLGSKEIVFKSLGAEIGTIKTKIGVVVLKTGERVEGINPVKSRDYVRMQTGENEIGKWPVSDVEKVDEKEIERPGVVNRMETLREVVPGFFVIVCALNPGGMWGLFAGKVIALVFFSLLCIGVIFFMVSKLEPGAKLMRIALGLILAGALGNLWDRLLFHAVRDFLDFDLGFMRWPTFNVADVWIVLGVIAILIAEFFFPQEKKEEESRKAEKETGQPVG